MCLCGMCSLAACMGRPCNKTYDALPIWAQGLVSLIFVGIPCLILTFFVAYVLNKAYYG